MPATAHAAVSLLLAVGFTTAAHAAAIQAVTAANPSGASDVSAVVGETITVRIDTTGENGPQDCGLVFEELSSGVVPAMRESINSDGAVIERDYRVERAGDFAWMLEDCSDVFDGSQRVIVRVDHSGDPIDGQCGDAHGQLIARFPSSAAACSAGDLDVTDASGQDGVYDWRCLGSLGGTDDYCMAIVYDEPEPVPSPDQDATFTGQRTGGLFARQDELNWDFPHATDCQASGDWSGARAPRGSADMRIGFLSPQKTYVLTCSNEAGEAQKIVFLP